MKYEYKLNMSPEEAEEKLRKSIRPLNIGMRFIEEVFILEKNVAYGKVKNKKFEIVVRTTGKASGKFRFRKASDTFHLRHLFGRIESVDGQTVVTFSFRHSILNVLALIAFGFVFMSCINLLANTATEGLSHMEIIVIIAAVLLHVAESPIFRKQSEELMLKFVSELFGLDADSDIIASD